MARRPSVFPRLSPKEALILDLLRGGEMYGLELVTSSDGALKRGTVYVTLGRMEEKGLIVSRIGDEAPALGGLPRRVYKPTAVRETTALCERCHAAPAGAGLVPGTSR